MAYWWVNQLHTHKQEVDGQYLWSPKTKRKKDGAPIRNRSYEYMAQVRPGDVIFGYWQGKVRAIGIATGSAVAAPRPPEFKVKVYDWSDDGWRLPVEFSELETPIDPKDHREQISPHLSRQKGAYSPLRPDTLDGQQFIYLASVPNVMGDFLVALTSANGKIEVAARAAAAAAESPETALAEEAIAVASGRQPRGQGRRQSPEERAAIEVYAVAQAISYLRSNEGGTWEVRDVSRGNPYDLMCRRGKERLRVEVKGTTSTGEVVVLTRNEVVHNRRYSPKVALLVVHGIRLVRSALEASGGSILFIDRWRVANEDLEPVGYRYHVPTGMATARANLEVALAGSKPETGS